LPTRTATRSRFGMSDAASQVPNTDPARRLA
jgi:hypothetical protein